MMKDETKQEIQILLDLLKGNINDLTKYTSPKKYGIYLQEKKHKRKRKW